MCGRYTLVLEREAIEARFDARFDAPFSPRYNAAPGQRLPVLTNEQPSTIRRLEWGLVPSWADDDRGGHINARAETVAEKPSFRDANERRRALVPADGFYEWVETDDGKQPYRIAFEDDRVFAMAGLWERWEPETTQVGLDAFGGTTDGDSGRTTGGGDGNVPDETDSLETFTIVTTEPNDVVGAFHHRMAAVLTPETERQWLDGTLDAAALEPTPADGLRTYPVSRAVNDPTTDDPSLIEPIDRPA